MNYPQQGQPQPKKGMSTLAIVLIILGVLLVLFLGTCTVGAIWVGKEVKQVQQNIADGGLVIVSPPEVVAALAGDKKEYVGIWKSVSEKSSLVIAPSGQLDYIENEHGQKSELRAPIAAFQGNDIEIKVGIDFKIAVSVPPHRDGIIWEMVVKGVTYRRQ